MSFVRSHCYKKKVSAYWTMLTLRIRLHVQGLVWEREEALASVLETEFVELPHPHAYIAEVRGRIADRLQPECGRVHTSSVGNAFTPSPCGPKILIVVLWWFTIDTASTGIR